MVGSRIVFLEFNELCPSLLQAWMAEGKLPNFRRFYEASQVLTGTADVEEQGFLEPWIQWYSLHTGLAYDQHGVFHLTDGPKAGHTDVWHALLDGGLSVGNCAGMNAPAFAAPGSFYLPDPWCGTELPYPAALNAYQKVVVTKVQENSNTAARVVPRDYLEFVKFLCLNGLRGSSLVKVGRQLLAELRNPAGAGWRRAVLLDRFQLDLFLHYWRRLTPNYASFFLNSTAHYQHAYFHLLEPSKFRLPPADLKDPIHQDAVLFGYQEMDRILADFFALERLGATLVLSTALSQQANAEAGKRYYRPKDAAGLLTRLGIAPAKLLPVMAHQYSAVFQDAGAADHARGVLAAVRMQGRQVFGFGPSAADTVFFSCAIGDVLADNASVALAADDDEVPFSSVFYRVPHMKTGIHHPDSVLWFKTGQHKVHADKVSILDLFPTWLDHFGIDGRPADGLPRRGRSLVDRVGLGRARTQAMLLAAE